LEKNIKIFESYSKCLSFLKNFRRKEESKRPKEKEKFWTKKIITKKMRARL